MGSKAGEPASNLKGGSISYPLIFSNIGYSVIGRPLDSPLVWGY